MATQAELGTFKKNVCVYYKNHKRDFPWRGTRNPYHILVSEIMLQQTKASKRTEEKYKAFIKRFTDFKELESAPLRDVLWQWQGLGYNRRAKSLKELAKIVVNDHGGVLPRTKEELVKLPGIGPYTAGAICVFAYNKPTVFIETNIRTVFIHFFFDKSKRKISDEEILKLVDGTLQRTDPRQWYQALMDYGAMLKRKYPNQNRRSKHYSKQSKFEGSNRQLRGRIIKLFLVEKKLTQIRIAKELKAKPQRVACLLEDLANEGFLVRYKYTFILA